MPVYFLLAMLIGTAAASGAAAQGSLLAEAEAACEIGEGADGFLHVKAAAAADLTRAAAAANRTRRARYAALAREEGVDVARIAARIARGLIAEAPAGRCYRDAAGEWAIKP